MDPGGYTLGFVCACEDLSVRKQIWRELPNGSVLRRVITHYHGIIGIINPKAPRTAGRSRAPGGKKRSGHGIRAIAQGVRLIRVQHIKTLCFVGWTSKRNSTRARIADIHASEQRTNLRVLIYVHASGVDKGRISEGIIADLKGHTIACFKTNDLEARVGAQTEVGAAFGKHPH